MQIWMINLFSVFFLSMILAGVIIPKILLISFRKQLFDVPDERKIHTSAVPRLGGLAFSPVIMFSVAIVLGLNAISGQEPGAWRFFDDALSLLFEFCGLLLLYVVGMADDLIGVRYSAKFVVQILCGLLLVVGGVEITSLHGLFGVDEMAPWISHLLTILVVVFFTNAINLIDGVDGLASGLSSAALVVYTLAFVWLGNYIYAIVAVAFLGVLVPFFYYNVFGNAARQKKIFMGDTGSLTLGFGLSFLSIRLLHCVPEEGMAVSPFVLAFAPMLLPCLDVLRVFFRRLRHHQPPFLPDRIHIHHKLLALGLSSKVTMVTLVGCSLLLILLNIALSIVVDINLLLFANLLAWIVGNLWMTAKIKERKTNSDFLK